MDSCVSNLPGMKVEKERKRRELKNSKMALETEERGKMLSKD